MTEHVQTKREIQGALAAAGLRPRKRFGQHFLIDGNLMRRLVDSAELTSHDLAFEVGPGTGGLTDLLIPRAGHVLCVEIDRDLHLSLQQRFSGAANITLLQGDVLEGKHRLTPAVAGALHAFAGVEGGGVKLVANLPYQIATPLVMNLLIDYPRVRRMCFTVQAEVGERIMAEPGGKEYGPLSILCQCLCTIATLARIGPQCFWPAPAVDSVMLRLDVRDNALVDRSELPGFAAVVRSAFDHRRKQLRTALKHVVADEVGFPLPEGFDAARRPEELPLHEWLGLYRELRKGSEPGAPATGRS